MITPASDGDGAPWPSLVIANGRSAPDIGIAASLVASGQAHAMLYASAETLGDASAAVVAQRQPKDVLLVGHPFTLSPVIEHRIRQIAPTATVGRLAGVERASTAAAAAQRALAADADSLVIAHGGSLADIGIAVSLVATARARAVLYANAETLGDATAAVISRLQPQHVLLVGGTRALGSDVEDQIGQIAPAATLERIAGSDRTSTAAAAAQKGLAAETSAIVIANGWAEPEIGIAASFAAAHDKTILLYSRKSTLSVATAETLNHLEPDHVILVGRTDTLADGIRATIEQLLPAARVLRIAAASSVATAAQAAQQTLVDVAPLQR